MPAEDGSKYILLLGSTMKTIQVECAVSPSALARGLSGRQTLDSGHGMLFIFPKLGKQGMWMPDMYFALDIIWLDENLSVVHITYDIQPCVTRTECPNYSSVYNAKYAIEMPSGDAKHYSFSPGLTLEVLM